MHYTDAGAIPDQDCDDCIQFVPGKTIHAAGSCRIVDGAISRTDIASRSRQGRTANPDPSHPAVDASDPARLVLLAV